MKRPPNRSIALPPPVLTAVINARQPAVNSSPHVMHMVIRGEINTCITTLLSAS